MNTWAELRAILADLRTDPRHPLQQYPNPDSDDAQPPFRLRLQAWADDIAADLHSRFGTEVDVTVGGLHYPERQRPKRNGTEPRPDPEYPILSADELTVSLDEPVVVASGRNTRSTVRIHNHQDHAEAVATNGQITGRVLDPHTGTAVGGFTGAQTMPGITFEVPAHQSSTIPLLIGTASSVGDLGYAIPPGEWAFDSVLTLERGAYRTPPLPITITR